VQNPKLRPGFDNFRKGEFLESPIGKAFPSSLPEGKEAGSLYERGALLLSSGALFALRGAGDYLPVSPLKNSI
jgi:hypothetical protein